MDWKIFTRRGFERIVNEDFAGIIGLEDSYSCVFAVADGMGDYDYGNLASELVVNSILDYMKSNMCQTSKENILKDALEYADLRLSEFCNSNKCRSGVTLAFGIIEKDTLYFSWQGNVRIYLVRGGIFNQLTSDHIRSIGNGNYRLSRCLKGDGLREDVPFKSQKLMLADRILICTDGLYSSLKNIEDVLNMLTSSNESPDEQFSDDNTCLLIGI